jgi:uncharacterized membrane protein (DUF441 family)
MVKVDVRVPAAAGVNVMLMVQFPLVAMESLAVQVVPAAVANSLAFGPLIANGLAAASTRFTWPVFDSVTGSAALVVPTV